MAINPSGFHVVSFPVVRINLCFMQWHNAYMRCGKKGLVTAVVLAFTTALFAQIDTLELKAFEVQASYLEKDAKGIRIEKIELDTLFAQSIYGITGVLKTRTDLNLRGYGPGSSFGLSIRGANPSQVQISINGIPFENPGLAQADLSLLPIGTFNRASVYRGGAGAVQGNATIGGAVLLDSEAEFKNQVSQTFGFGSFGDVNAVSEIQISSENYSSKTQVNYAASQNDFERTNPISREPEALPNAAFQSYGVNHSSKWLRENSSWEAFGWYQDTRREIPPNLSRPNSTAFQEDVNARIQIGNDREMGSFKLSTKAALDYGSLRYVDPSSDLDDSSNFYTLHVEAKVERMFGRIRTSGGLIMRHTRAITEGYDQRQERNSPALVLGAVVPFNREKTQLSISVRQEFLNGNALPLIPIAGIEHRLNDTWKLKANGGYSYRIPGLNDLFWSPGGNPDLLPESGWFSELGFDFEKENGTNKVKITGAGFYRKIDNWIQWRPGPEFWSPLNLRSVASYGAEISATIRQSLAGVSFIHSLSATYVESINRSSAFEGDQSEGKQLAYTPPFIANFNETILLLQNRLSLTLIGRYSSLTYTSSDNENFLDPYFLFDVETAYRINKKALHISLFLALNNVLDTEYQLQRAYNMPSTNFQTGIKIGLNTKKQ